MTDRKAAYVDYQQRASEFAPGDIVYPFQSGNSDLTGRVVAVYPAIGMVDVEWPHGSERRPVEELQRYESKDYRPPAQDHNNVPGGAGSVSVPGGPVAPVKVASRIADRWVKKALYWASADRLYRATKAELDGGSIMCPKCKGQCLKPASYKRRGGKSERLLGCPQCLFLIKRCDILGFPEAEEVEQQPKPFHRIRVTHREVN